MAAISFELGGAERRRLCTQWRNKAIPFRRYGPYIFAAALIGNAPVQLSLWNDHVAGVRQTIVISNAALLVLAIVAVAAGAIYRRRKDRASSRVSVAFETDSIALRIGSSSERVRWYAVKEAFQLEGGYALTRRDDSRNPILIPKRALPDGGAELWTYLEKRFTGSVPSVRELGFTAPTQLVNTTDQFLAARR